MEENQKYLKEIWLSAGSEIFTDSLESKTLYTKLIGMYSEPNRAYHNLQHIANFFREIEKYSVLFSHYPSVFLAIWFHDCIYKPLKGGNEVASAEFFLRSIGRNSHKLTTSEVENGNQLILATAKHQSNSSIKDSELFLDLDLSILGKSPAEYRLYSHQIREEYKLVPDFLYKKKRKEILKSFLSRKNIYFTALFHDLFEENARRNIENEIQSL